jgi:hypothetical protein
MAMSVVSVRPIARVGTPCYTCQVAVGRIEYLGPLQVIVYAVQEVGSSG